jgi:hypothetical protein
MGSRGRDSLISCSYLGCACIPSCADTHCHSGVHSGGNACRSTADTHPVRRVVLVPLMVAAVATGCGGGNGKKVHPRSSSQPPTLGVVWAPAQKGYGDVRPRTVFNGGDPTGLVEHVRWVGWGARRAVGTGKGWVPPDDGPYSDFRHETVKIVASNLGMCRGKFAYRTMQWLFPTSRHRRGARYNICTGDLARATTVSPDTGTHG